MNCSNSALPLFVRQICPNSTGSAVNFPIGQRLTQKFTTKKTHHRPSLLYWRNVVQMQLLITFRRNKNGQSSYISNLGIGFTPEVLALWSFNRMLMSNAVSAPHVFQRSSNSTYQHISKIFPKDLPQNKCCEDALSFIILNRNR